MLQINLLPWREQARLVKKKQFNLVLAGFIGLTVFFVLMIHFYFDGLINYQQKRNTFLQDQLTQAEAELAALNKKKNEVQVIDAALHFIISLREKSFQAVRLLDGLVRVVPEGVTLNKIARADNTITLLGSAQSDIQITYFMKNMENSPIFYQPTLSEISSKETSMGDETYFQLKVEQRG